jgi:hypothetical protein
MSSSASASGGNAVFRNGQTGSWETWQWNGAGKSGVCGNAELLDWMKRAEVWCASIPDAEWANLPRQDQLLSTSGLDTLCAVLRKTKEERTSLQAEVPKAGLGDSELWKWLQMYLKRNAPDARATGGPQSVEQTYTMRCGKAQLCA